MPAEHLVRAKSVNVKVLLARCVLLFATPRSVAPPGSSVHGILQVRILEGVAGIQPGSPTLLGRFFTV